jgi:predicted GNAT family N-acyltransferase
MELVELDELTEEDWTGLTAGESEPWGAEGAGLQWREKERYVALREGDGRIVAAAGAVLAEIAIEEEARFVLVGLGGLIVTRAMRGRGLMARLVDPLLTLAGTMGPERAMLFCRPVLVERYARLGFLEISDPVRAGQPAGSVEMPLSAMWRALHGAPGWPPGRVEVSGLPF